MTRKKKVLIVFDVAFPFVKGGAQRRFYEVGRYLSANGWQVDWLTFKCWDGPETMSQDGINYLGMASLPPLFGKNGKRNSSEPILFAFEVLRHITQLRNYDVIWIGQWPVLHIIPVLIYSRLTGRKVVIDWWEVWGIDTWRQYSRSVGPLGHYLSTSILRYAAKASVLVTDSRLEERRIRSVAASDCNIRYIPNGIPTNEIGDLDEVREPRFDVVSFGRLKNHKRVDLLVDALRIIRDGYDQMPKVAIVGDGPEREKLHSMAATFGLSNITFYGFVSDVEQMYAIVKSAKICVVTTLSGGGGNLTLLEAYGCGLPVIGFRCAEGIDPELVDNGRTGVLISPATSQELAQTIVSLLNAPDRLAEMRAYVRSKFKDHGWNRVAREYHDLFVALSS